MWFFGVLFCLSAFAVVFPILYGRMRLLDAEKLARARALWDERKPRSYLLEVTVTMPGDPTFTTVFTIRDGKFESQQASSGEYVAPMWADPVAAQFDLMQTVLDICARTGTSSPTAEFDPNDGHPVFFLFRGKYNQVIEFRVLRFEPLP
jgi:hypothetical protein